jgi:hypothetical protein
MTLRKNQKVRRKGRRKREKSDSVCGGVWEIAKE